MKNHDGVAQKSQKIAVFIVLVWGYLKQLTVLKTWAKP